MDDLIIYFTFDFKLSNFVFETFAIDKMAVIQFTSFKFTAQIIWATVRLVVTIFLKYKGCKYLEIIIRMVLTIYYSFSHLQAVTTSYNQFSK